MIDDADGPTSIAGVMGGKRSEVHDDTTRVLMEAATWNGPNIQRTSSRLGLRTEASGALREGPVARAGDGGQAVAAQLMVELCGATLVRGTIDVGGPGRAAKTLRLRDAQVERLLGTEVPRLASRPAAGGARVRRHRRRRRPRRHRPARLAQRRHPRGRPDRGGRALRHGAAAGHDPARHGASGRLTRRAALRRRAEDALVGAGLSRGDRLERSGAEPRRPARVRREPPPCACRTRCPRTRRTCARRCSARCSTSPSATSARGRDDVRLFEEGGRYCAATRAAPAGRRGPRAWRRSPDERTHLGALLTGPVRPPTWADPRRRRPTSSPPRACWRRCSNALRVPLRSSPRSEPFLHPAAPRACRGRRRRRLARRELHPAVAGRVGLDGRGGLRARPRRSSLPHATSVPRTTDLTSFPAIRQDLARRPGRPSPRARSSSVVRARGGALRDVRVFDVYRAQGRDRRWPCGSSSARRSHADRRGDRAAAREDRRRRSNKLDGELRG